MYTLFILEFSYSYYIYNKGAYMYLIAEYIKRTTVTPTEKYIISLSENSNKKITNPI